MRLAAMIARAPSCDRPARAREGDARSGHEPLADLLHPGEEPPFVDERLAIGVDDDAAVHDHGVDAARVCRVDEIVDGIEERLPFRTLRVEEQQIGFLAGLDRAELVALPKRLRAEPRR